VGMNCYGVIKWTNALGQPRIHVVRGYYDYDCKSIAVKWMENRTADAARYAVEVYEYEYLGENRD